MKLQKSSLENLPDILQIIKDAKEFLAFLEINQWQNGYPNEAQIRNDILLKESYIVLNDNQQIIATAMFTTRKEPSYKIIKGNWKTSSKQQYGIIHRLAIKKEYRNKGIAKFIFSQFHQKLKENNIHSLRIDTHEKNIGMQSLIKKIGYEFCGIIYTSYGAKRLAFEKQMF